jgi:HEAT repeats
MRARLNRILVAVAIGVVICAGGIWGLTRVLSGATPRYQGQPLTYWLEQANSPQAAASNQAWVVLNTTIIPQLTNQMFDDTNDSRLRLTLIDRLNTLPGVQISFAEAFARRAFAAQELGQIGPRANAAVPHLIQVLKGSDPAPRPAAAVALGQIRAEPATVVPLFMALLDDPQDGVPEAAVEGLSRYGSLAKAAVPKLLPLLKAPDKDMRRAAMLALRQIDPAAADGGAK